MAVRVIDVKGDKEYFHRDFHKSMDSGLLYLGDNYGENAVDDYLARFAEVFYAPLIVDIRKRGIVAMKEKIEHDYEEEKVPEDCHIEMDGEKLHVKIDKCPGVTYMNSINEPPCKWYGKTTSIVFGKIASLTDYAFYMDSYEPSTGEAEYRFVKRGGLK